MFSSYPDIKSAFGPFRSVSSEDTHYTEVLQAHGTRVLGTLEYVITQNGNSEVVNYLHDLGNKHITFNAKVEFMDVSIGDISQNM